MLAEENRESARAIGRSMVAALLLAGALFIVQTWVASLLVPDPGTAHQQGRPRRHGVLRRRRGGRPGAWLAKLTALATAIAWGFANSLVAQAATSRLLYAMARDRQLPAFLATVHPTKGVPVNATLLTARGLAGAGALHGRARRRHHAAQHAGQLRRADRVPGAARVGGRALRRPQRQPRLAGATSSHRSSASRSWPTSWSTPSVAAQKLGFVWLGARRGGPRLLLAHRPPARAVPARSDHRPATAPTSRGRR